MDCLYTRKGLCFLNKLKVFKPKYTHIWEAGLTFPLVPAISSSHGPYVAHCCTVQPHVALHAAGPACGLWAYVATYSTWFHLAIVKTVCSVIPSTLSKTFSFNMWRNESNGSPFKRLIMMKASPFLILNHFYSRLLLSFCCARESFHSRF